MSKRYEVLYVGGICDGFYDNKTNEYLDDETIEKLLNKEDYDSIWEDRFKKENEKVKRLQNELRNHPKIKITNKLIEINEFLTNENNKKKIK